jgi:hypothetical protein
MRESPHHFWELENLSGRSSKKPVPPAYDTGKGRGNTTIAPKKMRMAPNVQVYRAAEAV